MHDQPVKIQSSVAKYKHGRTPKDGAPDEVVTLKEVWLEADGTVVKDRARIDQLEKGLTDGLR